MRYKCVVRGFDIKLNKLLEGKIYDRRTKKWHNPVKSKGDSICMKAIYGQLKGVHIERPVVIHYYFYAPDAWDADGVISAFWKCFLDALQKTKVIQNDSFKYVGYPRIEHYEIDRKDPRVVVILECADEV